MDTLTDPGPFFTADLHLFHKNVLRLCNRPFDHLDQMHQTIRDRWRGGETYILGDLSFGSPEKTIAFIWSLPGSKFLVCGNHDRKNRAAYEQSGAFVWVKDLAEIEIQGQRIVMCHYPLVTWNASSRGSWNLHGHCHGNLRRDPHSRRLDVGVDPQGFRPISFAEIVPKMGAVTFKPVDHHGEE